MKRKLRPVEALLIIALFFAMVSACAYSIRVLSLLKSLGV